MESSNHYQPVLRLVSTLNQQTEGEHVRHESDTLHPLVDFQGLITPVVLCAHRDQAAAGVAVGSLARRHHSVKNLTRKGDQMGAWFFFLHEKNKFWFSLSSSQKEILPLRGVAIETARKILHSTS